MILAHVFFIHLEYSVYQHLQRKQEIEFKAASNRRILNKVFKLNKVNNKKIK